MATVDEVRAEVLEPMRSLYRVPYGVDKPEDALAQYARILIRYSRTTLASGWTKLLTQHKKPEWPAIPTLMEIMDGIDREARELSEARMRTPSLSPQEQHERNIAWNKARERADALRTALWRLRSGMELTTQNGFKRDVIEEANEIFAREGGAQQRTDA